MAETIFIGIYAFATIFGVGTLTLEMSGLLGEVDEEAGGSGDGENLEESDGERPRGPRTNAVMQQTSSGGAGGATGRWLFKLLWYVRLGVYFSLGFGPVGLVAILGGMNVWPTLFLSVPIGLVTCGLIWGVLRLQQRELDSSIDESELVGRPAQVIVSILPGELGKVRIHLDQLIRERYARGESAEATYEKGQQVTVTDVRDDCVYVRESTETT